MFLWKNIISYIKQHLTAQKTTQCKEYDYNGSKIILLFIINIYYLLYILYYIVHSLNKEN